MDTTIEKPKLKYLFTVEYEDGTLLEQTPDDVSSKDPLRSAFYDIDQEKVIGFCITNQENGEIYGVSLIDGHFEINGVPFFAHSRDLKVDKRRLIFFRRHFHEFNPGTMQETSHRLEYHFGWQANDETGKNHQTVLSFN
jgi:hypothetical protein